MRGQPFLMYENVIQYIRCYSIPMSSILKISTEFPGIGPLSMGPYARLEGIKNL